MRKITQELAPAEADPEVEMDLTTDVLYDTHGNEVVTVDVFY